MTRIFLIRSVCDFLNITTVGKDPPHVLQLSDGGHFENLALLPLLEKKLPKILVVDGSCNSGADSQAKGLLDALELAQKKLHCWFEGENVKDIKEDIRSEFLTKDGDGKLPRCYKFSVHYSAKPNEERTTGEILFLVPRHPSESKSLEPETDDENGQPCCQPETCMKNGRHSWKCFNSNLDAEWGFGPELREDEVKRLNWCCCLCCHNCSCKGCCHTLSSCCLGKFPSHSTGNQFFTPDMFREYHREGYAACIEAIGDKFIESN